MNETIQLLLNRKSIRAYEDRPISAADKELLAAGDVPRPPRAT